MKTTSMDSYVRVPKMTLKAMSKLVLSNDGVNITPLVEDLAAGPMGQVGTDLIALNIALVLKGYAPKLSEEEMKSRKSYGDRIMRFDSYSLISDCVTYTVDGREGKECTTLEDWLRQPLAE